MWYLVAFSGGGANQDSDWFESLVIVGPSGTEARQGFEHPERVGHSTRTFVDLFEQCGKLLGYNTSLSQAVVEGPRLASYIVVRGNRTLTLRHVPRKHARMAREQLDEWRAGRLDQDQLTLSPNSPDESSWTSPPSIMQESQRVETPTTTHYEVLASSMAIPSSASGLSPNTAAIQGDLSQFAIAELLEFLRTTRCSGLLVCQREDRQGVLVLHQGRLRSAELRLQAEEPRPSKDLPPGAEPIISVLIELVGWSMGEFIFTPKSLSETMEPEALYETQSLLLETYRQIDEQGQVSS